jgi:hypothetical protein
VCAHKIAAIKINRYKYAVERMTSPLFLTLTIRSTEYAREGLEKLKEDWFAFRRTKWWKACGVAGGIYGIELTWGAGGWHPHLHILLDCPWLTVTTPAPRKGMTKAAIEEIKRASQVELTAAWAKQTGQDVAIVWVKKARPGTIAEVLKYSLKPEDMAKGQRPMIEAIRCLQGLRMCATWGSCYGQAKLADSAMRAERPVCTCPGCSVPDWMPYEAAKGKRPDGLEFNPTRMIDAITRRKHNTFRKEGGWIDEDGSPQYSHDLTDCVAPATTFTRALEGKVATVEPKAIRARAYKLNKLSQAQYAQARASNAAKR